MISDENIARYQTQNSPRVAFTEKNSTSKGDAAVGSVMETTYDPNSENPSCKRFDLMMPVRILQELAQPPCILYYGGLKVIGDGKSCHDLNLITLQDEVLQDVEENPFIPQPKASTSEYISCPSCLERDIGCTGFCELCGGHQPEDGSQCPCPL